FGEQEPRGQLEVVARRAHSNAQGKLAHADLERLLANQIVLEAVQAAILPFGHVRQVDAARARHQRLLRSGLYTEQVGLQLGVAILLRPEAQRKCGKLIDHGDGQAVFSEVHRVDVDLARIASLDAHMFKLDRKSTRLNSSHGSISYAVFCLKKKKKTHRDTTQ